MEDAKNSTLMVANIDGKKLYEEVIRLQKKESESPFDLSENENSAKKDNFFVEERELLRKQLKLLSEQSEKLASAGYSEELPAISEQMVAIYSVLHADS